MLAPSLTYPPPPAGAVPHGLAIARWNDNEVIFFDHERRESWIVYPPRTAYTFARRVMAGGTLVERRRWSAAGAGEEHVFTAAEGCAAHGIACTAQKAIQAAIDTGFNPFA
jgi:hypothetical protein